MKASVLPTTLILLLTTRFSTSLPIPPPTSTTTSVSQPADCAYHTCYPPHLRHFFSSGGAKQKTPLTEVFEQGARPHYHHQSSPSHTDELDLSPDSPPAAAVPTITLTASNRLQYVSPQEQALERQWKAIKESKAAAAALHELPSAALDRFWETEHASRTRPRPPHRQQTDSRGQQHHRHHREGTRVYLPGNIYIKSTHYISRRPDIAVVGIVLLFLVLVVAVEAAGTIGGWLSRTFRSATTQARRGEIFLSSSPAEEDAAAALARHAPLSIKADPEEKESSPVATTESEPL